MNTMMPPDMNPPMELSFDVTEADFRERVLELSMQVPVLLDCWAPWCAPCKSLKPILEKLAQEYGGRFVLAKINTDEAPQISQALQIRSIPLVVLIANGRPVDQFQGALPESQVRAFLDKHLGPQVSEADLLREEAKTAPDAATALAMLQEALALEPGHTEVMLDMATLLVDQGAMEDAQGVLDHMAPEQRNERHAALAKRIELARNRPQGDPVALDARIKANPKDFEARFARAALNASDGEFDAAFDQLLEVVLRDKAEWREKARQQLIEWFGLCTDADAVSRGRRYLGMYLN
jgi:putative thioredoxin